MSTTTGPRSISSAARASADLFARAGGAVLALLVSVIHIEDQGGLTALKDPAYVGQGYRLLELAGVVVALLLLIAPARARVAGWVLAVGVAVGPLVGYALSRGPGLPSYTDDRGNWTELIGLQAVVIEVLLLALAAAALVTAARRRVAP